MAQIGELSFIIAALGLNLKVTSEFLYPIVTAIFIASNYLASLIWQRWAAWGADVDMRRTITLDAAHFISLPF